MAQEMAELQVLEKMSHGELHTAITIKRRGRKWYVHAAATAGGDDDEEEGSRRSSRSSKASRRSSFSREQRRSLAKEATHEAALEAGQRRARGRWLWSLQRVAAMVRFRQAPRRDMRRVTPSMLEGDARDECESLARGKGATPKGAAASESSTGARTRRVSKDKVKPAVPRLSVTGKPRAAASS